MEEKVITTLLLASDDVTDIVGDKIRPKLGEEGIDLPFILFRRTSTDPEYSLDGIRLTKIDIALDLWSNDYDELTTLQDAVSDALEGFGGTIAGYHVQDIVETDSDENADDLRRLFVLTMNFAVMI